MKCNLSKLEKIILMILVFFIILLIIGLIIDDRKHKYDNPVYKQDTLINTIVLDSIIYNIIEKDSLITKERIQYENKVKEVETYTDSASVELFKQLCTED